jgi:hypothetical protein
MTPSESTSLGPRGLAIYIVLHVIFIVFVLVICQYYVLIQLGVSVAYVNVLYAGVSFIFGYDSFFRANVRITGAFAIGLIVGIIAVMCMSVVVSILFDQSIFPDQRQKADFAETVLTIMFGYAAGNATANLIRYHFTDPTFPKTTFESIGALVAAVRTLRGSTLMHRIRSTETIVRALVALTLAVGALLLAIRKLIFFL